MASQCESLQAFISCSAISNKPTGLTDSYFKIAMFAGIVLFFVAITGCPTAAEYVKSVSECLASSQIVSRL